MKLNRNNADIEKLRDKKVAVKIRNEEEELDFRKWLKSSGINTSYTQTYFKNTDSGFYHTVIAIDISDGVLGWALKDWYEEHGYKIYEWEIVEQPKTYTIKERINRNNADINKLRDKKVAVRLVGQDAEIDFRKWLEENGIHFNDKEVLLIRKGIRTEISYCVEGNSWEWCDEEWFREKGYEIYEWGIVKEIKDAKPLTAEKKEILKSCLPQKTYTIRDIVDNKGKLYKDEYDTLYFYDDNLYCRTPKENKFRPCILNLKQMLDLEVTEYKEEPIKITFEEALKEMEKGKVCRCLFSNRCITISGTQFIDASNGEYTKLALPEIKGEWVVIEE